MKIPTDVVEYLNKQRVGVLAVEMMDGSPHGSTVHFAFFPDPPIFYFETSPGYRKTEVLLGRKQSRASFVVGVSEEDMKTLQLDGYVQMMTDKRAADFDRIYFDKFPDKKEKWKDQHLFTFTPTWWRFTDWTTPQGKVVVTSGD